MKRNVDLTESRMFSRNNAGTIDWLVTNIQQMRQTDELFRLDVRSNDEYDLDHQRKMIIATGNKKQRSRVKFYRGMDDQVYCARCGDKLNRKPWNFEIGLCKRCESEFNKDNFKLWNLEESIQNAVIRIA